MVVHTGGLYRFIIARRVTRQQYQQRVNSIDRNITSKEKGGGGGGKY